MTNKLQAAKDSFYVALRDGVQAVNPGRIAQIGGTTRIAVAMESVLQSEQDRELTGVFYESFGGVEPLTVGTSLVKVDVWVRYQGQSEADASAMDGELVTALLGGSAEIKDWSGEQAKDLGDVVYWGMPASSVKEGVRTAKVEMYVRV